MIPSLSVSTRASSMSSEPAHAAEPNKLFPKRAPSSSAQSTRRIVMGGLPLNCVLMRRRISKPASTFKQPSSQPPLGTESMWPPMRSSLEDSPRNVLHKFPAASAWVSMGNCASFLVNQERVVLHMGVNATRCAPSASLVSARKSFSSSTVRLA